MSNKKNILLAFYGDDFTGSTDALEFLSRAGARTVLFIEPPSEDQLSRYDQIDAIGVAGMTRSMSPGVMEKELVSAFERLKQLHPRHVHYKVCSTFDSSPEIGSIGKAIDTGAKVFQNRFIPLLVAAPVLGRYCLFGNLFARMGIGSNGTIYRLDRHPSMSKHPVTPAEESDLRLHLSKQTSALTGLLDILQLSGSKEEINKNISHLLEEGSKVILIDAYEQEQLLAIGELIDEQANHSTLFSAGSSGIEMALGQYWNDRKILQPADEWQHPGKADPLLVVSGSCSPVTAAQIEWAKENGFEEVILDDTAILNEDTIKFASTLKSALDLMQEGRSVVLHTNGAFQKHEHHLSSEKLGTALGSIVKKAAAERKIKRLVIAGGDTSSYTARAMGIESVVMIAPLVPGAPLCKATAPGSPVDGMEINFKGGQVGGEEYFGVMRNGEV